MRLRAKAGFQSSVVQDFGGLQAFDFVVQGGVGIGFLHGEASGAEVDGGDAVRGRTPLPQPFPRKGCRE